MNNSMTHAQSAGRHNSAGTHLPLLRHMAFILVFLSSLVNSLVFAPAVDARQFTQALPGYKFSFPRDHASHDDYRTEWWYFTGHLTTESKRNFGYELTFFRTALDHDEHNQTPWNLKNVYLAHLALSDEQGHKFLFQEKMNRAGLHVADAMQDRPYVYNENWSMELLGNEFVLRADSPEFSLHLILSPQKPVTVHGTDGVSQKADCKGCASHYYSITRLQTKGALTLDKQTFNVSGNTWMDHEFGSNQLTENQTGWDWYSIQLDNNIDLMLYMMRNANGTIDPNSSGTIIYADGNTKHISKNDFTIKSKSTWTSSRSKAKYPMSWHVSIPQLKAELDIEPAMKDQELITPGSTNTTYWEGSCSVTGTAQAKPITGKSYVEMTGYAERFNKHI